MRSILPSLLTVVAFTAAVAGCGTSTQSPLDERCVATCDKVDAKSPCAGQRGECQAKCKTLAADAASKRGTKCGQCVAGSFIYSVSTDGATCWGLKYATPDGDCKTSCYEADGSAGY